MVVGHDTENGFRPLSMAVGGGPGARCLGGAGEALAGASGGNGDNDRRGQYPPGQGPPEHGSPHCHPRDAGSHTSVTVRNLAGSAGAARQLAM